MANVLEIVGDHRFSDGGWEEKTYHIPLAGGSTSGLTQTSTTTVGDTTITVSSVLVPSTTVLPDGFAVTYGKLHPEIDPTVLTFISVPPLSPTISVSTSRSISVRTSTVTKSSSTHRSSLSTTPSASKTAVGLGLGLGIPLVAILLGIMIFFWRRRYRKLQNHLLDDRYTDAVPKEPTTGMVADNADITRHGHLGVQASSRPHQPPPYSQEIHGELP